MAIMNADKKTDPGDSGRVVEKGIGKKLYHLISRYGAENAKTIVAEVRFSVLAHFHDDDKCSNIEIEDNALEDMYRDYVAACKDPLLTFIEYKSLVEIIIDLNVD
jgi:hypothetical protein